MEGVGGGEFGGLEVERVRRGGGLRWLKVKGVRGMVLSLKIIYFRISISSK